MKYAIINEWVVSEIVTAEPEQVQEFASRAQAVVDVTNLEPEPQIGWAFDGQKLVQVAPGYAPKRITRLAFRNRLTAQEKGIIYSLAAQNNATGFAFKSYLDDLAAATFVDLGRPDTIASVNQMVALGIFSAQRANEILNNPVQEIEKFNERAGD